MSVISPAPAPGSPSSMPQSVGDGPRMPLDALVVLAAHLDRRRAGRRVAQRRTPARTVTPDENRSGSGPECTSEVAESARPDGTDPTAADQGMQPTAAAFTAQSTVHPLRSAPL